MERERGLVEGHGNRAVGLGVVLRLDLGFRPLPESAGRIDLAGLALLVQKLDRKEDVVGVGPHQALELERLEIALGVFLEMQPDLGAARHALVLLLACRRDLEPGAAGRSPHPGFGRPGAAAGHFDAVGDHEGGIEADTELADQAGPFLGLGQVLRKALVPERATVPRLSISSWRSMPMPVSAIVERAGCLVGHEADRELVGAGQEIGLGDRLVAQLVAGVGGVGDELAQEDVRLGVDRVNHQVQELGDLRLEGMGLGRCACGVHLHPLERVVRIEDGYSEWRTAGKWWFAPLA